MAEFFKGTDSVSVESNQPTRLTFSPPTLPGIADLSDEFWITSIQGGIEPNYQVLYAFNRNVYVNAFTPRLSVFQLAGVYIPSHVDCAKKAGAADSSQKDPAFMRMYWEYNIVDANADPENQKLLTISFNHIVIRGFLIKVNIGEYDKANVDGHTFTLDLLGFVETGTVKQEAVADKKVDNTVEVVSQPPPVVQIDTILRSDPRIRSYEIARTNNFLSTAAAISRN